MTARPAAQTVDRAVRRLQRRRIRIRMLLVLAAAALVILLILSTVCRPMTHAGRAMQPDLADGQTYFVNMLDRVPQPGERILIHRTAPEGGAMVRRVVGLPGDQITLSADGTLLVNDQLVSADPAASCDMPSALSVPAGYYFVLADHAAEGRDSRLSQIGLIAEAEILGVVW